MLPSLTELQDASESSDMLAKLPIQPSEEQLAALFGPVEDLSAVIIERARIYVETRKAKESLEEQLKKASEVMRGAEAELVRAMSSAGVPSVSIDDGGKTVSLSKSESVYYALPKDWSDDPSLVEWILESGGADIMKQSVHHSTFSSFCGELIDKAAREEVPGVINPIHPRVSITTRRGIQQRKG